MRRIACVLTQQFSLDSSEVPILMRDVNRSSLRRLRMELLESRCMFSVLRVGAWNTANGPNNVESETDFSVVIEAIGNQPLQGNTGKLALLSVSETDPFSVASLERVFDDLYVSADYRSIITSLDGGGDATGFIYDTTQIELVDSVEIEGLLTHHSVRGQFRPAGTNGEADLFAYSVHLKSGNTGSDVSIRQTEAAFLRADANALGAGVNVIFLGDFNWHTSTEPAYASMTGAGASAAADVVAAPGGWTDNSAFASLHSHSTVNMDGRFDMQMVTDELLDGVGLDYVDGSYRVFGNDGSHGLGNPIAAGTGASATVLAALTKASDHLPIIADYEVIVSTPGVSIFESAGDTRVMEGGVFDTYSIVLDTLPSNDVVVTVTPDANLSLGAGSATGLDLTFTPTNAFTPQTILVSAFNDDLLEGFHSGTILHSVSSWDVDYDGLSVTPLVAKVVDDDAPVVLINEVDASQAGADSREFIELYDGGIGHVDLTGQTVVLFNGSDDASYARFDLDGYVTDPDGFFVLGNAGVAGVDHVFGAGSLQNGADAVVLFLADADEFPNDTPVTTSNLIDAVVYGTNDATDMGLLPLLLAGQPQLNEDGADAENTHSLARLPDFGQPRTTSAFGTATPTPGALNRPAIPRITVTQSAGRTDVTEGGNSDSYALALDFFPQQDVTIAVQPDSQIDLGAGPGVAISLVFTPTNAIVPQTIVVTSVDDDAAEQDHFGVISQSVSSSDANYSNYLLPNVVANITDNDFRTIVINEVDSDTVSVDQLEFIELYDGGDGNTSLDGLVVVLFNGNNDQQYGAFDLDGKVTDSDGFFVLGNAAVANVDLEFNDNSLQNGADAVALYEGDASEFLVPTTTNLLDAWVYDTDDTDDVGLSVLLPTGASQINESGGVPSDVHAIARVPDGQPASGSPQYGLRMPTPGERNVPAGDYDQDGDVDNDDYVTWAGTFGSTTDLRADGNQNRVVDAADFAFWQDNLEVLLATAMASVQERVTTTRPPRQALANPMVVETQHAPLRVPTVRSNENSGPLRGANREESMLVAETDPTHRFVLGFNPSRTTTALRHSVRSANVVDRYFALFAKEGDDGETARLFGDELG